MTLSTARKTTTRTVATAAAVAAASTLAACGSAGTSTAKAPQASASTASTPSSSAAASPSATPSQTTRTAAAQKTQQNRASRSDARQAIKPATTTSTWSQSESVAPKTIYRYSADLPKGTSKLTRAGKPGYITITYTTTKQGDKVLSTKQSNVVINKYAVRRIVTIGTGQTAAQAPAEHAQPKQQVAQTQQAQVPTVQKRSARIAAAPTQTAPAQAAPVKKAYTPQVSRTTVRRAVTAPKPAQTASVGGSPNAGFWNNVARCESGNNWSINTGNGFFGGLQFTQQTWAGYGGLAYAPRADLASKAQQMAIADKVLADVGPRAWPVCGR